MTAFMDVVRRIVAAAGLTEAFESGEHFHIRIPNHGFMDLVIESWPSPEPQLGTRRISVAHYFEMNGDLVPDPDVEINERGDPINITLTPPGGYTEVRSCDGARIQVHPQADRDVRQFLTMWASNLKDQGFIQAAQDLIGKRDV